MDGNEEKWWRSKAPWQVISQKRFSLFIINAVFSYLSPQPSFTICREGGGYFNSNNILKLKIHISRRWEAFLITNGPKPQYYTQLCCIICPSVCPAAVRQQQSASFIYFFIFSSSFEQIFTSRKGRKKYDGWFQWRFPWRRVKKNNIWVCISMRRSRKWNEKSFNIIKIVIT